MLLKILAIANLHLTVIEERIAAPLYNSITYFFALEHIIMRKIRYFSPPQGAIFFKHKKIPYIDMGL
jgi:hypothetical protein